MSCSMEPNTYNENPNENIEKHKFLHKSMT